MISIAIELLERVAFEHKDTNKFEAARAELQALLRPALVPAGTEAPAPAFCAHGYTVCRPCKFPPDLGLRGAWAPDRATDDYPLNGFGPSGPEPI